MTSLSSQVFNTFSPQAHMAASNAVAAIRITFDTLDGESVLINAGEGMLVDVEENIAYCQGHYFDVIPDEYVMLS